MNPPYSPQQQFGPPPLQQNYADIKQNNSMSQPGQNATFNDQNAPPQQVSFQYKGPMGQPNNIGPNSPNPMQSGMSPMMPPGPMPPQASFPGPPQMGQPQRLNGPSMGQPGQLQRQTRSPNAQTQSSPRPMYPGSQIPRLPPRQMGPPPQLNQMGEVDLAPQSKQTPPSLQTMIVTSQFIEPHKDQTEGDLASPRPMGMPPGNVPPTAPKLESNTNLAGPNVNQNNPNANQMGPPQIGAPLRPQMNSNLSQQTQGTLPPTSINSQPSLNNYGTPKQLQSNTQEYSQKPAQYPGMPPPGSAMGMPRMAQPNMGQPPIGQPLMGQPPVSQPLMGQPPMGQPPMGQNLMGQPPMAQNLMGQPPMGQNLMGQPPMGQNPMAQPPMGQPPMGQPPMGQPPMGQPQMGHPAMGQPPMGQPPMGQPPMGQPPMGQPPMGQPHMGQPPMGQPPMGLPSMGHPGMGLSPMGQPAMVQAQMGQPPMGQPPMMQPQMGQPPMGMSPMGQPPMGMSPMGQPPMGQPGMGLNTNYMPPNPMGPSQLTNQMGGMQIGGSQRQYPGTPMKPAMNGENMPHMPPPLTQAQYMNRSQARSPQQNMGYPPMPAQQQMAGGPYPPQPNYQQTQQARRLDPDQMPSPIQVTQDDQRTRSGIFCTNQKGLVPPLVSTTFVTQDQGNASPRFIRSTMYNVPTTSDMMKQTAVPFGLVISPLARTADQEYPPPVVDFGELGPVRCIRCKAYMCPFMQFIDSGRRFQCLFCKATTEVPNEYFQHLDHTGLRVDRFERPELILGTYEFVATKDYCRNNTYPKPPAVIFIIDVSYNNMKSGLVHLLCAEMKDILKNLPIDHGQEKSKMKVGFITYNNTVHFYNIKGTLAQPQMMVVGDTQEMFMPLLDGFLCDVEESAAVIDSLMEQIPTMFSDTRDTEVVLLPAIQAGLEALKASECAGKLLLFHSTLPTAEAPGRLKNRDDRKLLGTEKERTVLVPQNQAYNQLGMDCVGAGCSVDLFIFNNSYIDIATIGQVSRLSGGEVFKYTYFQADIDGKRLISDVITDINRPVAFDTIMRVRTSTGVRPTDFFGHFYMSNTTDMEIAAVDCDKAVAVEIKHDDKLTEEEGVYIQVALLYTSCAGQRRLRVLNLSLKTCSQMADLYRSCELDTIVNFFAKQSVYRLMENNPKAVKDSLVNRCAQILACYRKNCASPSSAGQLILPECMKLLPLYVNCLLKSDALSGGSDMTLDDRSFVMQAVTIMDIPTSVVYFYPRLIPLHEIQNTENPEIPNAVRSTSEKMVDNGIYLLENGIHMLIWIGSMANPEWIQHVFGVTTATQVDTERFELPELENNLSITIRNLIEQIQIQRHRCMRLTLVKQRDKLEVVFRHFLVEDRGNDGTSSYVDFLCHMHKEIRQLLS